MMLLSRLAFRGHETEHNGGETISLKVQKRRGEGGGGGRGSKARKGFSAKPTWSWESEKLNYRRDEDVNSVSATRRLVMRLDVGQRVHFLGVEVLCGLELALIVRVSEWLRPPLIKLLAMFCIYHHEGVRLLRHEVGGVISTAEDKDARRSSSVMIWLKQEITNARGRTTNFRRPLPTLRPQHAVIGPGGIGERFKDDPEL
ncbi:hypothetical protein EYF80_030686 [Liparis tanakae]|uniref:Uncharacterized protein n=1 Tax=Liparis tanakae TaxID=230148 RepID=A0A4Z2H2G1_9TELE|nr:hypothetical protein EYF80_030686 [Liparis tanakae]